MLNCCEMFCEILCAIMLPPLLEFCICLVLTMLGYLPGMIYAVYVIVVVDRNQPKDNQFVYHFISTRQVSS
ncbi:hypothetical protein RND81_06G175900 [Saponaria officinalis]|uniref:Hydrophobic protein OSR8 n=1 Tax=Saponaria officinalis TaxID=3572 RepID=A0AAW1KCR2_SAPOF